jgi:leucyl aminopeptidase
MYTSIKKATENLANNIVYVCFNLTNFDGFEFSETVKNALEFEKSKGKKILRTTIGEQSIYVLQVQPNAMDYKTLEFCRVQGHEIGKMLNADMATTVLLESCNTDAYTLAVAEGMALGNYQFLKYFSDAEKRRNTLKSIETLSPTILSNVVDELQNVVNHTLWARDLVNEPPSFLSAVQLSEEIQQKGFDIGFKVEVFNKLKIESLRMGGLIAVNRGSQEPPTFTIMEYKHPDAVNKKPYVLVGKGVVFDTGGVNLKTQNMELMKSDMGGAAAVAGAFCAIAAQKLPINLVCLIPATDNRPGENAYLPGDVITMFDGTTVEVLNTDAEGRLILADALSYAKKYDPLLVIDVATLTGAAFKAIGMYGLGAVGNIGDEMMGALKTCGNEVYERVAELPFWEEYAAEIKSDIADLKNIGSLNAGASTAGKFLEHFTSYPWIHFDIAGPSLQESNDAYRLKGATGYSVRLIYHFLKKQLEKRSEE